MPDRSTAQVVEMFHLAFLQVLQSRLDPARYVLKGGVNLRYFFDSVRYSEDIDLDVVGPASATFAHAIDTVIGSPAIGLVLRGAGLAVDGVTKPKQTATTRRWKVSIAVRGRQDVVRTKIEFSKRNGERRYRLDAVPGRVVSPYAMRSPTVQHYTAAAATEQKITALAGRSATQARDVFDLDLLLRAQPLASGTVAPALLDQAADRGLELPYDAFRDQVLPFLDPEIIALYDGAATWEQLQSFVVNALLDAQ